MADQTIAAIILAAGKGTRMKSSLHKVLHPVGDRPMITYLMNTVANLAPTSTTVVVGAGKEQLEAALENVDFVTQTEQLGTGHAARIAVDTFTDMPDTFMVLYGDVPFVPLAVMRAMLDAAQQPETGVVVLGFTPADPARYGRLIVGKNGLERIVEYKDATEAERAVPLCNSGIMVIKGSHAREWLHALSNDNAAGEYYLTDLVAVARESGHRAAVVEAAEADVLGINSRQELAFAEKLMQKRWRRAAFEAGVTMTDPDTVYFSADTKIGPDVTIEPGVFFGPGVTIDAGATIKAYSHIEGAHVKAGASIGPFARLRPGASIGEDAKIGNFVEVKKATLESGVKVSHLSYIGDANIGANANIGAGTITCNYDGFLKYQTTIGAEAFIGSNTALVAPVTVGSGAIVGAGSVVTDSVDTDALAIARGRQRQIDGYAAKFRTAKQAEKAKKATEKATDKQSPEGKK